jgi:hypothetical protein
MMMRRHTGMGDTCNPITGANCAGTYGDPNCPSSCYLLGNGLDTLLLGDECWPCHNICPSGSSWDTTQLLCLDSNGNPVAGGTAGPTVSVTPTPSASPTTSSATGCPGYCSWLPFSSFSSSCSPCAANTGSTGGLGIALASSPFVIAAIAAVALYILVKK